MDPHCAEGDPLTLHSGVEKMGFRDFSFLITFYRNGRLVLKETPMWFIDCRSLVNVPVFHIALSCLLEKVAAEMAALMARISSVWAWFFLSS